MKKLENEYRQLMQNEVPDLWSRIEAGVDAKIAEGETVKMESTDDIDDTWKVVTVENKKRKVINWKKYSLPLVACIVALMCVPLLMTGFIRMASGGKAETTATATDDCAVIVTEDACDEEIDDACDEKMETESDAGIELLESGESIAVSEVQRVEEPESMLDEAATSAVAEDYKQNSIEESGLVQILTVIRISNITEEDAANSTSGTIYYLDTEEVGECALYVPDDAEFVMDADTQFKIKVEQSDEGYDFVFVGIIK